MSERNSGSAVSAFSQDQAAKLTGLSKTQLSYWDRTDFFEPSFAAENRRTAFSRIYSFRDLVCLQVLKTLRNDLGVSLPHLREVKDKLAHLGADLWSKTTLYVVKKRVVFADPDSGKPVEVVSGQYVIEIPLRVVSRSMQEAVSSLWRRPPESIGRIAQSRNVSHNQAVVAGTRVPVRSIKEFAAAGHSIEEIVAEFPILTPEDVKAAIKFSDAA